MANIGLHNLYKGVGKTTGDYKSNDLQYILRGARKELAFEGGLNWLHLKQKLGVHS